MTSRPSHLPQLDGLRAIAVLLVLWAHAPGLSIDGGHPFKSAGAVGVELFFVLSGFLITRILLADQASGNGLGQFWVRRASRIFPAYGIFIAAVVLLFGGGEWLLRAATYTLNFADAADLPHPVAVGHLWSLCVEEQFYLLWPLLVLLPPRHVSRWLVAGAAILSAASVYATMTWVMADGGGYGDIWRWLYYPTWTRVLPLATGGLLAYGERSLMREPRQLAILGVGCLAACYMVEPFLTPRLTDPSMQMPFVLHWQRYLFAVGVFAVALWSGWSGLRAVLADPVLARLGQISYGVYLYHLPVYVAFGVWGDAATVNPVVIAAAVVTTLATAAASYHYIEAPIMRWARRPRGITQPVPVEAH